jgi:hypothetical protein
LVFKLLALTGDFAILATALAGLVALLGPVLLAVGAIMGLGGGCPRRYIVAFCVVVAITISSAFAADIPLPTVTSVALTFVTLVWIAYSVRRPNLLVVVGSSVLGLLYVPATFYVIREFVSPPAHTTGYDPTGLLVIGMTVLVVLSMTLSLYSLRVLGRRGGRV